MRKIILIPILIVHSIILFSQTKVITQTHTYQGSDYDSKVTARQNLIEEIKEEILWAEVGTYVLNTSHHETWEQDGNIKEFFRDHIFTISMGSIQIRLYNEKWNDNQFEATAEITIKEKDISRQVQKLLEDYTKIILKREEEIRLNKKRTEYEVSKNGKKLKRKQESFRNKNRKWGLTIGSEEGIAGIWSGNSNIGNPAAYYGFSLGVFIAGANSNPGFITLEYRDMGNLTAYNIKAMLQDDYTPVFFTLKFGGGTYEKDNISGSGLMWGVSLGITSSSKRRVQGYIDLNYERYAFDDMDGIDDGYQTYYNNVDNIEERDHDKGPRLNNIQLGFGATIKL